MSRWRMLKVPFILMMVVGLSGCVNEKNKSKGGKESSKSSLKLSIQTLKDNSSFNMLVANKVFALSGTASSALDPVIEGLKVKFHQSIDFCTGVYSEDGECRANIYTFSSPVEINLTQNVDDQINITSNASIPAGTYTHARLAIESKGAIKAYYQDGADVVYTTNSGIVRETSATPGPDYDYYVMTNIYHDQGNPPSPHGFQETTYFDTPFVYDGTSAINLKVHVDLMRAGKFTSNDKWYQYYLSLFMTFEDTEAIVKTFELSNGSSETSILTLVLNSAGQLVGGRTRGGAVNIQQFLKNWDCTTINDCSFLVGDFGYPSHPNIGFKQAVTGFDPEAISGTFTLIDSAQDSPGTRDIDYTAVSR